MSEFEVQCDYSRKEKRMFFNDERPKEYHAFLVVNPEIIPDEYLYFSKKKNQQPCWIWILDDLVKGAGINFGEPLKATKDYKFFINLGGKKVAKFNTNNSNRMVLKTRDYFENTIKKIGFWGDETYFYKSKENNKNNGNSLQDGNKNNLTKIFLFALPIILLALFFFLIIKWASKKTIK